MGADGDASSLPPYRSGVSALEALKRAVLPGVAREPCLVSFSGGQDSSLVLAAATSVAREQGLPAPVPITVRFTRFPPAQETSWQERVVHHLGLKDWQRWHVDHELDWIGPLAQRVLRRHGVLYPANCYVHVRLFEAARGGALLTGWGGDDVFSGWRWRRAVGILSRQTNPRRSDVRAFAKFVSPPALERLVAEGRMAARIPQWLSTEASTRYRRASMHEALHEPRRWDRRVGWLARRRYIPVVRHSLDLLARDAGASVFHPLLDSTFLATLAGRGGYAGWSSRQQALKSLFRGLLPEDVLARSDKARTGGALSGPYTRAFAESWSGLGVDPQLVRAPEDLRYEWFTLMPHAGAVQLLQSAWLANDRPRESDGGVTGAVPATAG